jgi:cysteinyl-tRNA synthetase
MAIQVFDTLTHKKQPFTTIEPGKVRMYVCGPTVYAKAHVGHAMSALVFDVIRRYLQFAGYEVRHVMNYTDVDDKIILRANQIGKDPAQLGQEYINEFNEHLKQLNVLPATLNPRATQEMVNIIKLVQDLIDKGYAYQLNGDVYYRVREFKGYGKLSGRKLDEMQAGARIDVNEGKEDPMDFALWKSAKPGEPAWDSPWGKGRPGWHIECSAMSMAHLGEQIDIHGGGNDLIFPHHENEIAQSEASTSKPFARYWVHNGMLQFSGNKMSKSLGNLVTIEEFLSKHSADSLRMMVLNSGYRNPLTFNDEVIGQAESALERLQSGFKPALLGVKGITAEKKDEFKKISEKTSQEFDVCMQDDFNTPSTLAGLFNLVRTINQMRDEGATDEQLEVGQSILRKLTGVLGLKLEIEAKTGSIKIDKSSMEAEIKKLKSLPSYAKSEFFRKKIEMIELITKKSDEIDKQALGDLLKDARNESRKLKYYTDSDEIRDFSNTLGLRFEDSKGGTILIWQ